MNSNKNVVEQPLLVGLDIGSSKVTFLVCDVAGGELEVVGVSSGKVRGIQNGMVTNIDQLVNSIRQAKRDAETMASCEINSVVAGISGAHIRSKNSYGVVSIRGNEVTHDDVSRVIDAAQAVPISTEEKQLHALSQQFVIDGQSGIREPIGLYGVRLEAYVHVVMGSVSPIQNILRCMNCCDLEVEEIVLNHIATGQVVLTDDERELGVCMIDIGDGTADIATFCNGSIQHSTSFEEAGANLTKDIAVTLRTSTEEARRIKHRFGVATRQIVPNGEVFELAAIGDSDARYIERRELAQVIESQLRGIFQRIYDNLEMHGQLESIHSGLILTGGSSKLEGIETLAEDIFERPVRLGVPQYYGPLSEVVDHPKYSTVVGLCEYRNATRQYAPVTNFSGGFNGMSDRMFARLSESLRRLFRREQAGVFQPH